MTTLPFASIEEAKDNGKRLHSLLGYHLIKNPKTDAAFSLQQAYEMMAKLYGFHGWPGLTVAIEAGSKVEYLDASRSTAHRELSARLMAMLSLKDLESLNRIYAAFSSGEFGCTERIREQAVSQHFYCIDYLQAGRIELLNHGYNRQSRYNNQRTPYEAQKLEYTYKLAVAKELGLTPPKKPRYPKFARGPH